MKKLIFATNNQHKVEEVRLVLRDQFEIITLKEAGIFIDIPEPHDTLEANAAEKSRTIFNLTSADCFSEDTGLEVEALNGEPGVRSARYADEGDGPTAFASNIDKLLHHLREKQNRNARFRTVISLFWEGKEYQFEGVCDGTITEARRGEGGFGYDPVFIPQGYTTSFAEMLLTQKSNISHRKKALAKLIDFLQSVSSN